MRRAALIGVGIVLAGCAVGPTYHRPPVDLAPELGRAADSVVIREAPRTAFWDQTGDSILTRLIREGLAAGYDVRVAQARVRGARAARLLSVLDLAPTVTVSGGYTRQRLAAATFPGFGSSFPDQSLWDAGFDASWEIDVFGGLRRSLQGQTALVASAQEDLRDVRVSLAAELARSYFELRGAQGQLAVAQRNAENQRRTLQVVQDRLDAGRGTAFDTERAKAQLGLTLAAIPSLESQIAAVQYQIGVLVARSPEQVATELADARPLPVLPAKVPVTSPDSLIRQRPDVVSAERRLAAQTAFVGAARADYLPRLSVQGGAGITSGDLDSFGGTGTTRYAVGPVISWPALNLGRVKARVDASRALEDEARAQYQQTVLRAVQEAEASLVAYDKARTRLDRLEDAASASEHAADYARLRFEGGVADFLEVLDAERTMLDAQNQLASGRTDATTAYVAVYKALGGTWPLGESVQ
jgi:NodT family efflux transporter outer membrane factor (OMF) lipoprotein